MALVASASHRARHLDGSQRRRPASDLGSVSAQWLHEYRRETNTSVHDGQ